jgi:hypothetical protein
MRQDWAASAVELTIVVVGIFLGLQAADWNERRIGAREEESILQGLTVDFGDVHDQVAQQIQSQLLMLYRLGQLVDVIDNGGSDSVILREARQALIEIPYQSRPPTIPATLSELVASGRLWRLSDRELRHELQLYRDQHDSMLRQWEHFADDMRLITNELNISSDIAIPAPDDLRTVLEMGAPDTEKDSERFWELLAGPEVIEANWEIIRSDPTTRTALARAYDNRRARLSWQISLRNRTTKLLALLAQQQPMAR